MATLDFQPRVDSLPADPEGPGVGGNVLELELFTTASRTGPAAVTVPEATRVQAGLYRYLTDTEPAAGRYWPVVHWIPEAGDLPVATVLPPIDLPIREDLAVSAEQVATRLGVPLPITDAQRDQIEAAIDAAQGDVAAYLGRVIFPTVTTEERITPVGCGGWRLLHQPVLQIVSEVEETDTAGLPTGYWSVTYLHGLDVRLDPMLDPIVKQIMARTLEEPQMVTLWFADGAGQGAAGKRVRSVGAAGQSISYEYGTPSGTAGSADRSVNPAGPAGRSNFTLIDRWRLRGRRVFTRSTA